MEKLKDGGYSDNINLLKFCEKYNEDVCKIVNYVPEVELAIASKFNKIDLKEKTVKKEDSKYSPVKNNDLKQTFVKKEDSKYSPFKNNDLKDKIVNEEELKDKTVNVEDLKDKTVLKFLKENKEDIFTILEGNLLDVFTTNDKIHLLMYDKTSVFFKTIN
jgi:hypothetical protein